jgi:ribose/xylose/arabinose/galactoside ABC-type transport system permease subunit
MADGRGSVSMAVTSGGDVPENRVAGRQTLGGMARTRRTAAQLLQAVPMLPVLILTSAVFCITVDGFTGEANLTNMARFFAPLFIAAVGVTFVILLGEIDLSIGSTLSLASVLAALTMRATGSVWLGAAAGIGTGLTIGAINGAAVARFRFPAFIHTLGMLLTVRAVGMLVTGGHSVGRLPPEVIGFGRGYLLGLPNLLWLALLIYAAAALVLARTALGREFYLIGTNRRAAAFNGLRVMRVRFLAFLVSGGLAGLAGVAVVFRLGSGGPILGDNLLLMAIAAVVLSGTNIMGGDGGVFRTATGAAVIVLLDKGLNLLGLEFYDQAIIVGAVILLGSALGVWLHGRRVADV